MQTYIFQSERLGFRLWTMEDFPILSAINTDPAVMHFFPKIKTISETKVFIEKSKQLYKEFGYCFFAVDRLDQNKCIGFIGLNHIDYAASFTPCVEIGWRLAKEDQGNGFATEGAKACLKFGFEQLNMKEIYSVCPRINLPSEHVMKKIGMQKQGSFNHPMLKNYPRIENCFIYKIDK
jgi:RimJ/RimL family protein N-acetyltransferase